MTDEERLAVARVRLRMAGMHSTWIEYAESVHCKNPPDLHVQKMESLADAVENDNDGTYIFTRIQKDW